MAGRRISAEIVERILDHGALFGAGTPAEEPVAEEAATEEAAE